MELGQIQNMGIFVFVIDICLGCIVLDCTLLYCVV